MNLRNCQAWLSAIIAYGLMLECLHGESSNLSNFEEARGLLESIPEQAKIERRICEEELARGVEQKLWPEDDRQAGLAWLDQAFTDPWTDETAPGPPISLRRSISPWADFINRLNNSRGPIVSQNKACQWLYDRITTLNEVRNAAAQQMRISGLAYCEELWMQATDPADLAPAVRLLIEIRQIHPAQWADVASRRNSSRDLPPSMFRSPYHPFSEEEMAEAYDFWNVLTLAEPLVPDPAKDLGRFRDFHSQWSALRGLRHRFTMRPRIAEFVESARLRYFNQLQTVQQRLEDLILSNAPASEFRKELLLFAGRSPDIRPWSSQLPVPSFQPAGGGLKGFRDLIPARNLPPANESPLTVGFRTWESFLAAEEMGDAGAMWRNALYLDSSSCRFSSRVALKVYTRTKPYLRVNHSSPKDDDIPALLPPVSGDPLQDLVALFPKSKGIVAWTALLSNPRPSEADLRGEKFSWDSIASRPRFSRAFDLKEIAVRQALDAVLGSARSRGNDPIPQIIVDGLEQSCSEGSKGKMMRLLAIEVAYDAFHPQVRQNYQDIARLLPEPGKAPTEREIEAYRFFFLTQATSPAAGRFAAEQIKKLGKR